MPGAFTISPTVLRTDGTLMLRALPAPLFVATAITLSYYGETAVHWSALIRPLLVVMIGAAIVSIVVFVLLRRPVTAAALASMGVAALLHQPYLVLAAGLVMGVVIGIRMWRLSRGRTSGAVPASAVIVPTALLLAMAIWQTATSGVVEPADFTAHGPDRAIAAEGAARPNIYLLLLDGYPRGDTLAEMGLDNAPFLEALEAAGLRVDRESQTAYRRTELTLTAMHAQNTGDLDALQEIPRESPELLVARRHIRRTQLVDVPVMDALRAQGYRLAYVPSPVMHTDWSGWDERRDGGHLTDLEIFLLQRTPARHLLGGWVMDQQRDRVEHALAAWSSPPDGQQLVFAHLMVPHTPFLWGPRSVEREPLLCWYEGTCNMFHARAVDLQLTEAEHVALLIPQIEATNERVLRAVQQITERDAEAIIVIFSDHGARHSEKHSAEWHRNFFAARGPVQKVEGLLWQVHEAVAP